jgi:hypothetical protein
MLEQDRCLLDLRSRGGENERGRRQATAARRLHEVVDQGQVAPPLESAAVLSPLPQITNVPTAVLVYLYVVPEPVQPAGSVGRELMKGPPV